MARTQNLKLTIYHHSPVIKAWLLCFLLTVMVVAGCSSSSNSHDRWDYNKGFIVSKESGRILVVGDKPSDFEAPLAKY
ncbi:ABC-type Fe3+-citrate transport system substrate-binding protein [Paenibacillus rhizosphaerae]|uniref:ABC-type Fe3+-citrate transport system substrate-binding protein n=1 Tax=Paenibacillus rhizosphaerae TaxID=297318 RepID=A0A839TP83_9BACL|nr:ABC-type Fe3+-citrate transport system substrate-binding protein [Paenibacillus rhizosphaerae]